jgi:hypothetical protein
MESRVKLNIPKLVKEQPGNAAIFSKINRDKNKLTDTSKILSSVPVVANDIRERIKDNDDILQLFPDIELAMQILTSSILAPNDMITTSLIYKAPDIRLPLDVKQTMLETIEKHISTEYNFEDKLTEILRESMFLKGAYIEAIIPEASLDNIINGDGSVSVESYRLEDKVDKLITTNTKSLGILSTISASNKTKELSTEHLVSYTNGNTVTSKSLTMKFSLEDIGVDISDNISIMSANNNYTDGLSSVISRKIYGPTTDSMLALEDMTISMDDLFRNNTNAKAEEIIYTNTDEQASRKSIGKPLVMKLPVESVIPVHVKSNPSKHLGYFVLLDENGVPMNIPYETEKFNTANGSYNMSSDTKINLINKAKTALNGITKSAATLDNMEAIYNDIVDKALRSRLKDGIYGDLADIKENADLYRVMLARALQSKKTRVLYIPAELVSYYAFEYRENGTGKSLLEKASMLFSIRSILLFTKVMATVKNSTTTTKVSAKLDDDDQDPEGTMEHIISESLKTRQTQVPIGIMNVNDLVDWSQRSGMVYNFQHPSLPDMTIDVQDETSQKQIPDQDLDETIANHIIMSFGLTPEIVQAGYSSDFATTVVAKNLLFAKRISQTQTTLKPMISANVRKYIKNDMVLQSKLRGILEANIADISNDLKKQLNSKNENDISKEIVKNKDVLINYILDVFIKETSVGFPTTELTEAEPMKNAFQAYKEVVDEYLDMIFSNEALPNAMFGDLSDKLTDIKSVVKTIMFKKWMSDNNYMPEISEFLSVNEEGKPVFNILEEYSVFATNLAEAMLPFIKDTGKFITKYNTKLGKIDTGSSSSDSDYSSDNNEDENSDDSDSGDSFSEDNDGANEDEFGADEETEIPEETVNKESEIKEDKKEDKNNKDKSDEEDPDDKEDEKEEPEFKLPKF